MLEIQCTADLSMRILKHQRVCEFGLSLEGSRGQEGVFAGRLPVESVLEDCAGQRKQI